VTMITSDDDSIIIMVMLMMMHDDDYNCDVGVTMIIIMVNIQG